MPDEKRIPVQDLLPFLEPKSKTPADQTDGVGQAEKSGPTGSPLPNQPKVEISGARRAAWRSEFIPGAYCNDATGYSYEE